MPTFTVDTLSDSASDTGLGEGATGTLREAIAFGNAHPGTKVVFAVSGTVALASQLPTITAPITIDGAGQTVSLDGGNLVRPFLVGDGSGQPGRLTLANVTIEHGRAGTSADGSAALGGPGAARGGAILVSSNGSVTLDDVTLYQNGIASGGAASPEGFVPRGRDLGAAIFVVAGGRLALRGDTSESNGPSLGPTDYGAALFVQGTRRSPSVLTFGRGDQAIYDGIADYVGDGGINPNGGGNPTDQGGSVTVKKVGSGTLTLQSNSSYSGGTLLDGGTLEVAGSLGLAGVGGPSYRVGTGPITFGSGPQTLRIDVVAGDFTNTLVDLGVGDAIDLPALPSYAHVAAVGRVATSGTGAFLIITSRTSRIEEFSLSDPATTEFSVADDGAGGTLVTAIAPTRPQPGPTTLAFDRYASLSGNDLVLSGTVEDASGVAGIEVYARSDNAGGVIDLGPADVSLDGAWRVAYRAGRDVLSGITAVETGEDGGTATAGARSDITTDLRRNDYQAEQDLYDVHGGFVGQAFLKRNSSIPYETAIYTASTGGNYAYTYSGVDAFAGTGIQSYTDTYAADGTPLREVVDERDGGHVITALAHGQTLHSRANDTFDGPATDVRFVFTPGFGQDDVTNFIAGGSHHDVLVLSRADFGSIAGVLAHTEVADEATLITDPSTGDRITLDNVTKAELVGHRADFRLFG